MQLIFFVGRLGLLPFTWLGAFGCYWLSKQLYGQMAGTAALALWSFCPTILGHACLFTTDVPSAAVAIGFVCLLDLFIRDPTLAKAINLGVGLGLAALCKFSLVILLPVMFLVGAIQLVQSRSRTTIALKYAVVCLVALFLLNCGYLCRGTLRPLGSYEFVSHRFSRLHERLPASLPIPLPFELVEGADLQARDFEYSWSAYLNGEFRQGGFASYFLYASLYKIPIGTLLALGLALAVGRPTMRELPSLTAPALLFAIVSTPPTLNVGVRYLVPILPFVFVFISRLFRIEREISVRYVAIVLISSSVLSSCLHVPYSLGYFSPVSRLFGKPQDLLIDSNIDWGQDLYLVRDWWLTQNHEQPLHLAFWGPVDPAWVGISFMFPPQHPELKEYLPSTFKQATKLTPGLYAISINYLVGFSPSNWGDRIGFTGSTHPSLGYFNRLKPESVIGTSVFVYRLDQATCDELNRELGLQS